MNIHEARRCIGQKVVYRAPFTGITEEGVITSVNSLFAFVRYGSDYGSKATDPAMLTAVRPEAVAS